MVGKSIPIEGGGPSNEHIYTSGLLLYYYLTGDHRALDSVCGLADFVCRMDDGAEHVLGLFSNRPTGFASSTTRREYHGPGRGAGNAINALLDGWLCAGRPQYMQKCEVLIRRTIHPRDNIDDRDLLNAELRWSYTVYLQALLKFLETTKHEVAIRSLWSYVRDSVLHYARWMTSNERPYLSQPERLEYPTETWAAQELRKGNVLLEAAQWTCGAEGREFRERGLQILDDAWESLLAFESRFYTRPLALVLQQGPIENALRARSDRSFVAEGQVVDWGRPSTRFVPQKEWAQQALRTPPGIVTMSLWALHPSRWWRVYRRTWCAEQLRRLLRSRGSRPIHGVFASGGARSRRPWDDD